MKKLISIFITLLFLAITIILFMKLSVPHLIKISSEEAKEIITSMEDYVIIDIRSSDEYNEKRIPESISIPKNEIDNTIENKVKNKVTSIILYGNTNQEVEEVGRNIINKGYKFVYSLGKIDNWKYNFSK